MDKETKERLRQIRAALKKYGFDKIKCSVDGAFKVYSFNGDML